MFWFDYVSYFFGGVFCSNAIPHMVSGMMGRAFQSPIANPPGKGHYSSTVNVLWGALNLAVGYGLILHVGTFELRDPAQAAAVGAGALAISLQLARHFGQFHGGDSPNTQAGKG